MEIKWKKSKQMSEASFHKRLEILKKKKGKERWKAIQERAIQNTIILDAIGRGLGGTLALKNKPRQVDWSLHIKPFLVLPKIHLYLDIGYYV